MDTSQYLEVFIDESTEHLDTLYEQLLQLEKNPEELTIIEEIFRAAHTIKGMSATMGYSDLANLTHHIENIFEEIRNQTTKVNAHLIDGLFFAVDQLNEIVEDIAAGGSGERDIQEVLQRLEQIQGEADEEQLVSEEIQDTTSMVFSQIDEFELAILEESKSRGFSNYEITVTLSEDCLLKGARVYMVFEVLDKLGEVIKSIPDVSELEEEQFDQKFSVLFVSKQEKKEIKEKIKKISEITQVEINNFALEKDTLVESNIPQTKQQMSSKNENLPASKVRLSAPRKTIRINIERLDVLMNLFEELVIDRGRLEQISTELQNTELQETVERMSRVSSDLQNIILNMRMVPIDHVFNRFPGMIRQLARDLNKEVVVNIVGAETELDRTVIDEIGDPLVHLIRNAIDHGLESTEKRIEKGKPEQGTIDLKAYHSGNHVFIEISDDGAGINKDKVIQKAIENQLITEEQVPSLSNQQIYELILASGFSTTDKVSDVSGRGVGLDVVKNTIESLGGNISIQSEIDQGSTFSIQLPLTLSIISVLLIELHDEKYAIPLSSIIETAVIHKEQVLSAHHKKVMDFRGRIIPLVDLNDIFGLDKREDEEYISVVIVRRGDKMTGLIVDSFIGQQEVVLKSLGNYLTNIFAISGATILGDGEVALIIDSNSLVK